MTRPWSDPEVTDEVAAFYAALPSAAADFFDAALELLADRGPSLGRPIVDEIDLRGYPADIKQLFGSRLKELRMGTSRVLFVFGPDRVPVLLVAGDKAGAWNDWYPTAIARAARAYRAYLGRIGLDQGDSATT